MHSLYIVSMLIFVRSIVRVVEYLQGFEGYILSHEVFLYLFDGVPMFLSMLTMNFIHPREVKEEIRRAGGAGGSKGSADGAELMGYTSV